MMPAILMTPPAGEPITLGEAKAHLRVSHGDDDQLIASLITSARRVAEARTGLCFMAQCWMCFRDEWPQDGIISLPVAPLLSFDELGVYGEDDQKAVIEESHYVVDPASRPPRLMLRGSRQWQRPGRGVNGIGMKVTAGFGTAPESVPQPLRQAVLLLVAHWYGHRGDEAGPGLPVSLSALLQPYRAVML